MKNRDRSAAALDQTRDGSIDQTPTPDHERCLVGSHPTTEPAGQDETGYVLSEFGHERGHRSHRFGNTARIELQQKESAALLLVVLPDSARRAGQAEQAAQEAVIPFVRPTYVSGSPPSVGPKSIESSVITDSKEGVLRDLVVDTFG